MDLVRSQSRVEWIFLEDFPRRASSFLLFGKQSVKAGPESLNLKTAIEMATKEHKDLKEKGFRGQGQRRVAHPASE